MFYTWKIFLLLMSHFLVDISTINIDKVGSKLFSQRWSNADEHALTQLSFITKYHCLSNPGLSTLNRRNSIDVVSTLFYHCWNNFDKFTSTQLSISIKYQLWKNVNERWQSKLFQRWLNVDVFIGMVSLKFFHLFMYLFLIS